MYINSTRELQTTPIYFKKDLRKEEAYRLRNFKVNRKIFSNEFTYPDTAPPTNFKQEISWQIDPKLTKALLEEQFNKPIFVISMPLPPDAHTIYNVQADSLYKEMLQESDNFLGEQLLLICASTRSDTLNTEEIISYAKQEFLQDLPDPIFWFDGFGNLPL